ncbi:unnamed protein product [Caenorhabditis angaria]|uniref:Uncharacterized protein n=1 Tax=Caenorhabditis angaria TaxID=860376 RepID=A0A9P1N345_9PELO|nr:unnamed protein product [Caenorhabditis angaria]
MINALYYGFCEALSINTTSRSLEEKVIETLENAQISGKIPRTLPKDSEISIEVSKYGLKILSKLRIPLLNLILVTIFDDGFGKVNGVIVENCDGTYKMHLIQFLTEISAHKLCKLVNETFQEAEEARHLLETTEPPSPSINI